MNRIQKSKDKDERRKVGKQIHEHPVSTRIKGDSTESVINM